MGIAPLVLITYIENAFKYGVNPDENSEVIVAIRILKNDLYLKVQNNIVSHADSNISTGIVITNTTERLQLLYPQKHQLGITESDKKYLAELTLDLS